MTTWWSMPGGIHTARQSGTIHIIPGALTRILPIRGQASCPQVWRCHSMMPSAGGRRRWAMTGSRGVGTRLGWGS